MFTLVVNMKKIFSAFCLTLAFATFFAIANASQTSGTIDPASAGYSNARVCDNAACTASTTINFKPTGTTAITVVDSSTATATIAGYAWSPTMGWINFAPTGYGVTVSLATGKMTGYAYSQIAGYINFAPTLSFPYSSVTIDSNGYWNGYAWAGGEHGGWITFDCSSLSTATCVKTDWVPTAGRTVTPVVPSGGGGGGGGGGFVIPAGSSTTNVVKLNDTLKQSGPQSQPTDYANDYRADIDDSGLIDIFDYNLLMVNWSKAVTITATNPKPDRCKVANKADLNCDGKVDLLDFNLIMIYWQQKLPGKNQTGQSTP